MKLFTQEFFDELVNRINSDAEFQKKSSSLNVTVLMTAKDLGKTFALKFTNGKASAAAATLESPFDFSFMGDYATWVANHRGEGSLEKMIMSGKLKMKGSMAKILGLRSQLSMVDLISQKIPVEE